MPPSRRVPFAAACALLLLTACGEDDAGAAVGSGGGGGNEPTYHGSVSGTVVDDQGQPLAALGVTLCSTLCRVVDTDAGGAFLFEGIEPDMQVLENLGLPGDDFVAAALVTSYFFDFVSVGVDEEIVIERPFVVRTLDTSGPLTGPQQLTLDGDLEVAFSADLFDTEDNPLPSPAMELHFGATEIPQADWPTAGYDGWSLLRVWGLAVWDLHEDDAFAVTAPLGAAGPLPAGSEVAFLVADYTYGFMNGKFREEEAELSADGMSIVTPAGKGIDRATMWLAVVRDGS